MDRLSSLLDDIICAILSFLPTKTSVRTSILSKRWECLWTGVPALDFTCDCYDTEMVNSNNISKVMLHHNININTFRLDCRELVLSHYNDSSCYELEWWIDNISARNVRNLVLNIDYSIKLPRCLFTCKTLVYLSLIDVDFYSEDVPVGSGIDLPVLKKLELVRIEFDSEELLSRLLFGCPVLEELIVDIEGSLNKVVCSPTITKLTISSIYGYEVEPYKMKLDVPALGYLRLSAHTFQIFSAGTLSSLNEADVDLVDYGCIGDEEEEKIIHCSRYISEFLVKLSKVRCLKLSTRGLKISYDTFSELPPKFHKLTQLELCGDDCRFIPFFLENANSLRLLTIDPLDVWGWRRNFNWRDPKQVPACLISHLETVNLVNFRWSTVQDFDMIRYIMRNGKVLKRVRITTRDRPHELDCTKKFEVHDRLVSFERGLMTCQVTFD